LFSSINRIFQARRHFFISLSRAMAEIASLVSASYDIVCHAEIKRAVLFARKEKDVKIHGTIVMDSGLAPSGAPRNDEC
jgi:hypothetical protein